MATGLLSLAQSNSIDPYGLPKIKDPSSGVSLTDTSVLSRVNKITQQDSALNEAAKTEGLKAANRRGLLNSSMAVGASQDAVLKNALPIASQDSSQAFTGQENALGRAHETALQTRQIASTEKLTLAQIESTEGLAAAQRALDLRMQGAQIDADKQAQIRQIASTEGLAAADRALQKEMQQVQEYHANYRSQQDIANQQYMQQQQLYQENYRAQQEWQLEYSMQQAQLAADEAAQIRQIASTEGIAAAERALDQYVADQQSASAEADRALQEQIASWNLSSTDQQAASSMVSSMESMYQSSYQAIMANTNLDADQRQAQLDAASALRDDMLSMVEQMYGIDLTW